MPSPTPPHHEAAFETVIVDSLTGTGGWVAGLQQDYDQRLALDTGRLFQFLGRTQPDECNRLTELYGDDTGEFQRRFAEHIAREIDRRGVLDVLRHPVKDRGVQIRLAFFKPAGAGAADANAEYDANILTVTRQLHYSAKDPEKSLDLALFCNGLPVATAELKNPLTGQTVEHAKRQYRTDRDRREPLLRKRALVHFAVDTDEVHLTTRLAGNATVFLPFNTGSRGPGVSGGKGNPPAGSSGYATGYLWEQIWQRDTWLDLLRRFLHLELPEKGARTPPHERRLIFPRYHQWHAVDRITDHVARHGSGHNYLVQHSAGSGKSNTIAWLAHRLSTLHTVPDPAGLAPGAGLGADQLVFDKTIVVTDRSVLDKQLGDTIYQFDHTPGVVKRITTTDGSKSGQLAAALADATTKIIIVTLQTFPYVLEQVTALRGNRYAIVADEAHSSQSGDSASAMKRALRKLGSDDVDADGDPLTASALARGRHPELSFFAFTATPKPKTLELFGTPDPVTGNPEAFHTYSMRQAIEEGFILDVLGNYITYANYFRLAGPDTDDHEVDTKKARSALVRFAMLSPESMQQRAEVIVEHVHRDTRHRMGGRAKAMVVTGSRNHAVKLYRAITEYAATLGYGDCKALVAISGELEVDGNSDDKVTETTLNGFGEKELPERFGYTRADDPDAPANGKPEYRILVVADKYQTGFDQPLLTTMFVDRKLTGVQAVQTLSRLNRTHPAKSQDDLFVLDFANDAEDIRESFQRYYETTLTTPTDPNLLYTAEREVMEHQLLVEHELADFAEAFAAADRSPAEGRERQRLHAEMNRHTEPAAKRFVRLQEEDPDAAESFRTALRDFVRMYAFLAQIVPFTDSGLERLFQYGKLLLNRLPNRKEESDIDLSGTAVEQFRLKRTGVHDERLASEGAQVLPGFSDGGSGTAKEPETGSLQELIDELNKKYGGHAHPGDMGDPLDALVGEPEMANAADANGEEDFGLVFDTAFEDKVYEIAQSRTDFLRMFSHNDEFREEFVRKARGRAYRRLRRDAA
ncbi:type I restriction endonuclease subunit R [Streptomonospora arabica]|uniref:Type I restriction endonuclease subunit R n=1 Tax=Streptomonospora arabica TaxID=412417 RepID=A0ABV9STW0_9ACTN